MITVRRLGLFCFIRPDRYIVLPIMILFRSINRVGFSDSSFAEFGFIPFNRIHRPRWRCLLFCRSC